MISFVRVVVGRHTLCLLAPDHLHTTEEENMAFKWLQEGILPSGDERTLEFTALALRDDSARRSHSIGAVKPPRRKAGSVLCVSTSFALMAANTTALCQLWQCRVLRGQQLTGDVVHF